MVMDSRSLSPSFGILCIATWLPSLLLLMLLRIQLSVFAATLSINTDSQVQQVSAFKTYQCKLWLVEHHIGCG